MQSFWNRRRSAQPMLSVEHEQRAEWVERILDVPIRAADYFVIDIETSGFSAVHDIVLSLAAGCVTGTDPAFQDWQYDVVRHEDVHRVPAHIWQLTGLTPEQVRDGREWQDVLRHALNLSVNRVWIAHHAGHERSFLQRHARIFWRMNLTPIVIDTAIVAQALGHLPDVPTLESLCGLLNIPVSNRHQADADVRMTAEVWRREMELCERAGIHTVGEAIEWSTAYAMR